MPKRSRMSPSRRSRMSSGSKRNRRRASRTRDSIQSDKYRGQNTDFAGFNSNKSYIPSSRSYTGERAKAVKDFMREQFLQNIKDYQSVGGPGEYSRQMPEADELLSKLGKSHISASKRSKSFLR